MSVPNHAREPPVLCTYPHINGLDLPCQYQLKVPFDTKGYYEFLEHFNQDHVTPEERMSEPTLVTMKRRAAELDQDDDEVDAIEGMVSGEAKKILTFRDELAKHVLGANVSTTKLQDLFDSFAFINKEYKESVLHAQLLGKELVVAIEDMFQPEMLIRFASILEEKCELPDSADQGHFPKIVRAFKDTLVGSLKRGGD